MGKPIATAFLFPRRGWRDQAGRRGAACRADDEGGGAPDDHVARGDLLAEEGDAATAQVHYRTAIRLDRWHAAAYARLARLLQGRLADADFDAICRVLTESALAPGPAAALHLSLAAALGARGEHRLAKEHLRLGNALRRAATAAPGKSP
jgi:hypothetical protein